MRAPACPGLVSHPASRGFTLIELMVVLALIALLTGIVSWRLQPGAQEQLAQESQRLALWLETARHQARVEQRPVQARISAQGAVLIGVARPDSPQARLNWLYPDTRPRTEQTIWLGPEVVLPAQTLELMQAGPAQAQVRIWTSGIGPWKSP
jgi:general secretion pathway protein H